MAKPQAVSSNSEPNIVQKIGLVDMGSGTIRLVVYGLTDKGELTKLFTEKSNCSLGESFARDGTLDAEATECAISSLARFKTAAKKHGVESLHAFGTAAIREAKNRETFLTVAKSKTSIDIDVISGEEEANLQAVGSSLGLEPYSDKHISADLGRTSLDIAAIKKKPQKPISVLLGSAAVSAKGSDAADYIASELEKLPDYPLGRKMHLVGGSWRRMAKAYLIEQGVKKPRDHLHGYEVNATEFLVFLNQLEDTDTSRLRKHYGIEDARIKHMPAAIATLRQLSERLETSEFVFSMFGVREGYLLSKILNKKASEVSVLRPQKSESFPAQTLEAA